MVNNDLAKARFYGLLKAHKPNCALRPIVALRDTPMFNMAHWVAEKLKPLVKDWTTALNFAGQFLEKLKDVTITADEERNEERRNSLPYFPSNILGPVRRRNFHDRSTGPGGSTRRAPQQHLPGRPIHHVTRKGQTTSLRGRRGDKDN